MLRGFLGGTTYFLQNLATSRGLSANGNSEVYTVPFSHNGEPYCGTIGHHQWRSF